MAKQLDLRIRNNLLNALEQLSVAETFEGRSSLLNGIPKIPLNRSQMNVRLDLSMIVDQFITLGRDKQTGVRPLLVIVENAQGYVSSWQSDLTEALQKVHSELEIYYEGDSQPTNLPPIEPEKLLFKGRDERVSAEFISKAIDLSRSVCRMQVPRIFHGVAKGENIFGTGWIIAPSLIITNHHVIDARECIIEPSATKTDFVLQAEQTIIWFDYLREGGSFVEIKDFTLEASDESLDYAILRLNNPNTLISRKCLNLIRQQPKLNRGYRLNILQHSRGGPLIYAIRNNFYIDTGNSNAFLRYLTDTEPGASGSPVLNDMWEVIGLHHAAQPISHQYYANLPKEQYQTFPIQILTGEIINYHNEGVAIHSILNDLPQNLREEIQQAQNWKD